MVENYENKNVNGQAAAESVRTNQSNVQTDQEVKGDLVYDDKVIQKSSVLRLNKLMDYLQSTEGSSRMLQKN